jgi:hypothetical protein
MKFAGIIIVGVGIAFLGFVLFQFFQNEQTTLSPVPTQEGIKVIYITPKK